MSKQYKNLVVILLLLFALLLSVMFLFHPGFFESDDGEWMVIRFSAFHEALRDGQFPVRFLGRLNYGYGYPVANFLYPGFMYLAEGVHLAGFGFVDTIKILFALSMIGSAFFTFLWLSRFFDRLASLVGALFYLYTPYHLFDLYKRGSVGEVLALALVPFILWQIEKKSLVWSSIGIAMLILSHNTLALLFLPIILLYMLIRYRKSVINNLLSIFFGLGISAFFWMPAIFELGYTQFSHTQVSNYQKYFASIQLIGLSTLVVFISVIQLLVFLRKTGEKKLTFVFFVIIGLWSLFLSNNLSDFLWRLLPSSLVQFPFRLLSITLLSLSFCASYIVSQTQEFKKYFIVGYVVILVFSAFPYIKPSQYFNKGDLFYSTNEGTTNVQDEYMPRWVKQKPTERFRQKIEVVEGKAEIKNISYNNSKKIMFEILAQSDTKVRINTIFYPGWRAFVDGKKTNIEYSNNQGVMEVSVLKGERRVRVLFSETPQRFLADFITLFSFIVLILIKLKDYKLHKV